MLEDEYTLYIYTDGSCFYKEKGRGGVGVVFLYSAENGKVRIHELKESGYKGTTSIQMEMQACIVALVEAKENPLFTKYRNVVIYSDAQFLVSYYQVAEWVWKRNDWMTVGGAPVSNVSLWKSFLRAKKKLGKQIEIRKVPAHSNNMYNNRAHTLAQLSAQIPTNKPLQIVRVRRRLFKTTFHLGCINMQGQLLSIHIYKNEYLHEQDIEKCWYEIIDQESKYYQYADVIYSAFSMKVGHSFEVRVNNDQSYPRVLGVVREVENPSVIRSGK